MADLSGQQLKDSYQNLLTIDATIESNPTSGQLENGLGNAITALGIGTDSPVSIASGYTNLTINGTGASDRGGVLSLSKDNTEIGRLITFGASGSETLAIQNMQNESIVFRTTGSDDMTIDSSGNVLVGKTASSGVATGNIEVSNSSSASVQIEGGTHEWSMLVSASADALRFYQDSTERLRIDSSGTVQVRNQTPTIQLYNTDTSLGSEQTLGDLDWYQTDPSGSGANVVAKIRGVNESSFQGQGALAFHVGASGGVSEAMRIDSSGQVGIGVSPSVKLDIVDSSNPANTSGSVIIEGRRDGVANVLTLRAKDASDPTSALPNGQGSVLRWQGFDGTDFENMGYILVSADGQAVANSDAPSFMAFGTSADGSSNPTERMRITSGGDIQMPLATNAQGNFVDNVGEVGSGNFCLQVSNTAQSALKPLGFRAEDIRFATGSSERLRIDSSGNVLIGTDSTDTSTTSGFTVQPDGQCFASADGQQVVTLSRLTSDGEILRFRKGGTTVGSIGTIAGYTYIGSTVGADAFISFGANTVSPATSAGGGRDNAISLGSGSYRFKDLYLSGNAYANGFYQNGSVTDNLVISQGTGTSKPSVGLWGNDHASFPGQVHIVSNSSNADADSGEIRFYDYTGSAFQINMTIDKSGNVDVAGALSKGSGSFKIDHPLESKKDTHYLVHSFVESPQANNIYRGSVDLADGQATVNLDEVSGMTDGTFVLLNTDIHVYTSNESDWDAVKGSVSDNVLTIECQNSSSTAKVNWLVIGERHDQHMIETDWTDENGKVIVEPLKPIENELEN